MKMKIDNLFYSKDYRMMELPDDILGLIRVYSRPRFKHFRIYNQAVKVLDKKDMSFVDLKEKLEKDDQLVPVLVSYMEAVLQHKINKQSLNLYNDSRSFSTPVVSELIHLMGLTACSLKKESQLYIKLICYLYGIKSR
jgi:hypothetical protein